MAKTKWFCVAVSGITADNREITQTDILDIAATYNPKVYGSRIWLEHIRGLTADSAFNALGDVLSLEARDLQINGKTEKALYAQIEPTAELIAINTKSQKIYTSIEILPNFAKTGKSYLGGLAVTDSPASLGTDALKFSIHRKQAPENTFTAGYETHFELEPETTVAQLETSLFNKITAMFKAQEKPVEVKPEVEKQPENTGTSNFNAMYALIEMSKAIDGLGNRFNTDISKIGHDLSTLTSRLDALSKTPDTTPAFSAGTYTGSETGIKETDC